MGIFDRFKGNAEGAPEQAGDGQAGANQPRFGNFGDAITPPPVVPTVRDPEAVAVPEKPEHEPVTYERVMKALHETELSFSIYPDKTMVVLFTGVQIHVRVRTDPAVMVTTGRWQVTVPIHARPRVLETCSEINNGLVATNCYLTTDDQGASTVFMDVVTIMGQGMTDEQLAAAIEMSLSTVLNATNRLNATYPDIRFGPDPLVKEL